MRIATSLKPSARIRAGFVVLALLAAPLTLAEIGVWLDDRPLPHGPYNLSIIEDPDPIPQAWTSLSPLGGNRRVLNPNGDVEGDGRPSMLFNTVSALPIVAWGDKTADGYDVVVSQFANGQWSTPLVLATAVTTNEDPRPRLVLDPVDGSVHLLYWENEENPRVLRREAPADLSSWSEADQVSQGGEIAMRPAGTFHQGTLLVAYEAHTLGGMAGTPRQIVLAYDTGSGFGSQVLATSHNLASNDVEVHSALGKLWVEWIDAPGDICWTRESSPGSWAPIEVEPFSGVLDREFHARGRVKAQVLQ